MVVPPGSPWLQLTMVVKFQFIVFILFNNLEVVMFSKNSKRVAVSNFIVLYDVVSKSISFHYKI